MIDERTPAKLAEIIRDTWPNIYRPPASSTSHKNPVDFRSKELAQETQSHDIF